ncbi:hypothetical protein [Aquabacterium sp.]|uniref:hypothetical protein n=1 Tax=Aquabacterium sp. TaxID=1872578 RepID=UPI003783252F
MHVPSLIACTAAAVLLAACGGGTEPVAEAPAASRPATLAAAPSAAPSAAVRQLRHALATHARSAAAAPSREQAAEQLFAYAQSSVFAGYFPGNPATQSLPPFRYRYYAATGVYLGVVVSADPGYALDGVYVMGGPFGDSPVYVGPLSQFITPVDPGPGPGPNGPNNGCHDLALLEATGTHIELALQYSGSSSGSVAIDWRVTGPKTFEGQAAVESLIHSTGHIASEGVESTMDIEARSYARRTGDAELTLFGEDTLMQVSGGGFQMSTRSHSVNTPPALDQRYGLAVGQSLTASVTATTTTTTTGLPGVPGTPGTVTDTSTSTIRFVGRESITVPAGRYATCRFETTYADDPDTLQTSWVIDGKGIPVKTVTAIAGSTEVQQATAVRLNGQPL